MNAFFFAQPSWLWALSAVAAVFVLYLFHRRYRRQPVTGLFLWGETNREGGGGRRLDRPRFGRSLLLDLLAACLLALALAGPMWRTSRLPLTAVLDDCFAMRARDAHLEARRLAGEALGRAAREGRRTAVVLAGRRPSVLLGMGEWTAGEIDAALAGYLPSQRGSDLQAAVALAREAFGPRQEIRIATNSGGIPPVPGRDADVVLNVLPGRGGNLAFGEVWRVAVPDRPGREKLLISAVNFGAAPVEAVLTVAVETSEPPRTIHAENLLLRPDAPEPREIPLAAVSAETIRVSLRAGSGDVIADDSAAFAPPSPSGAVTYALEGVGAAAERFLRLGLEAAGCRAAAPGAAPDLLVTGDPLASGRALTVEIPSAADPGLLPPPYIVDFSSPLCRDVELSSVVWAAAVTRSPDGAERVFISAGGLPLFWRSNPGRLHLNLVVGGGDLVMDPSWPVLLANVAAEAARSRPGLGSTLYRPGEPLRHTREPGGEIRPLRLESPDGATGPPISGRVFAMPLSAGLYGLREGEGAALPVAVAPLYGGASDTRGLAAVAATSRLAGAGGDGGGAHDLSWLAAVLAFFALALNWRGEPR